MLNSLAIAAKIIKKFEGCVLHPYRCPAGRWTIGYGNTILSDGTAVTAETPAISQAEADALLLDTVRQVRGQVRHYLNIELNPDQEAAVISLVYNIGIGNFRKSDLLSYLNNGAFFAAEQEFTRWNKSGKIELKGLTRRRQFERSVFLGKTP